MGRKHRNFELHIPNDIDVSAPSASRMTTSILTNHLSLEQSTAILEEKKAHLLVGGRGETVNLCSRRIDPE